MDDILFAKNLKKPQGEIGKTIGKIMNEINSFITRYTYKQLGIKENDTILEIGFGNGKFIKEIFDNGINANYKGVDISDVMVEEATIYNQYLIDQGKVELIHCYSKEMPYNDCSIDKVCLVNTIYFWEDPIQDLTEIHRVLKENGEIYISIRSKDCLLKNKFTRYYFKLYEYLEIKKLLIQSGFKGIRYKQVLEPESKDLLDVLCIIAIK